MAEQIHTPMEQFDLFHRYVEVANWAWKIVSEWKPLAVDTIGKQLIRAADSIGANLVEGDGRFTIGDSLHFFVIARASARETRYWIECAVSRNLVSADVGQQQIDELTSATQMLNRLISYRRQQKQNGTVRELSMTYQVNLQDPFTDTEPSRDE